MVQNTFLLMTLHIFIYKNQVKFIAFISVSILIVLIFITNQEIDSKINPAKFLRRFKCNPIFDDGTVQYEKFSIDGHTYPKYIPIFFNKSINFECLNKNKQIKQILLWNSKLELKKNQNIYDKCPVSNCHVTTNRTVLSDSNMVVFQISHNLDKVPINRFPNQRWIFKYAESPDTHYEYYSSYKHFPSYLDGRFNLSITYRSDSVVLSHHLRHSSFIWKNNTSFKPNRNFHANKTKFAFQVVSDCTTPGNRELYVKELKKYIQVDVYGKCGKECPNRGDRWLGLECKQRLSTEYKFYFSFENTICTDYITEKFFAILKYDIIPVVYGGGEYERHLPKSGFINAFDFATPHHLAEYLLEVGNNDTLYNSYFKWKRFIKYRRFPRYQDICELCIMLNLEQHFGVKTSIIESLNKFWDRRTDCKTLNEKTFKLKRIK